MPQDELYAVQGKAGGEGYLRGRGVPIYARQNERLFGPNGERFDIDGDIGAWSFDPLFSHSRLSILHFLRPPSHPKNVAQASALRVSACR